MSRNFFFGALAGALGMIVIAGLMLAIFFARGAGAGVADAPSTAKPQFSGLYTPERIEAGRTRLALEDPRIIRRFLTGGIFGNKASRLAGLNMFSRDRTVTEDIRAKTERVDIGSGVYLVRFPIVNAAVFETETGVTVIDTGMAAAGPVLLEQIREVTDKQVQTIILTHGHVDHLTGLWALYEAFPDAQIIGHEKIASRIERYGELRGSIARYMSQPFEDVPAGTSDLILPDTVFSEQMILSESHIAGEKIVIAPHKGETDDQAYVWLPERKVLVTADYYQGFLPNLGNGKRVQRFGTEWIAALREMARLDAEIMLPMHGPPIFGADAIKDALTRHADALDHIRGEVISGLNAGLRKDEIIAAVTWPERFAEDAQLARYYVSERDVAKMFLKAWTGWWNDRPADWSPSTLEAQARHLVQLSGGMDAFLESAAPLIESDIVLASHMADWAFYAQPDHKAAQNFAIEVYRRRLLDGAVPEQEALAYFDHIALIRGLQLEAAQ